MKRVMGIMLAAAIAAGSFIATVVEPAPAVETNSAPALVYVAGEHGKKFHAQECAGLKRARAADISSLTRQDAEARGYTACRECFAR